jgi:hypothetical protein
MSARMWRATLEILFFEEPRIVFFLCEVEIYGKIRTDGLQKKFVWPNVMEKKI